MGALLLLFGLSGRSARAQSSEQLPPVQRIYLGLAHQFAPSPDTILILLDPGITIDAWYDSNSDQIQTRLSQIVDEGLRPQPLRATNPTRLSSTYEQILRDGFWGQLVLDKKQQQELADANKVLFKDSVHKTPTSGYAQYLQLKERYTKAQALWDSTPEDKRTEMMRANLDAATRDLELRGDASLYQGALETLDAIAGNEPSTLRDRWIAQLEGSTSITSDGKRSFPVDFIPPLKFDYATRWTSITIDSGPIPQAATVLNWPSAFVRPWRFCNSSAFGDTDDRQTTSAISSIITLEAKAFAVSRPWMDEDLFAYKGWKTKDANLVISTGNSPLTLDAGGILPVIVTHIVIARNVTVDASFSQEERAKITKQSQAGKCTAFGPFVVTGQTDFGSTPIPRFPFGGGFYLPSIQVIAVVAKAVAKSPDPDSSHYRWP